jgi:Carboxypeptidase regulatory-like domain
MICWGNRTCIYCFGLVLVAVPGAAAVSGASWNGRLSDASGKPVADAILLLHPAAGGRDDTTTTTATGKFAFTDIAGGSYEVSLQTGDKEWKAGPLVVKDATPLSFELQISAQGQELRMLASGGEVTSQFFVWSDAQRLSSAQSMSSRRRRQTSPTRRP